MLALISSLQAAVPPSAQAESWGWMRRYNAAPGSIDEGFGVAAAADGSVYVTGETFVGEGQADLVLRKYSANGTLLWADVYDGPDGLWDTGRSVAVAADGCVYVAGYSSVPGQDVDVLLRKYSAAGEALWTRTYNDPENRGDQGEAVAVGRDGSVYVAGTTSVGGLGALLLLKYSPSGTLLWSRTYRRTVNFVSSSTFGTAVTVDKFGAVYVAGYTGTSPGYLLLRKYSPAGTPLWTRALNSAAKWGDSGFGVAAGPDGICVTGKTCTEHGGIDMLLVKYSLSGGFLWLRTYDGPANRQDGGRGVAVREDGSVYVAGSVIAPRGYQDLLLRKYSPDGTALWTKMYDGGFGDEGIGVAVGPDGSVHVVGTTWAGAGAYDLLLVKYK
ncbi:MAG TPA: hypothetical protein VI078_06545 [bacterium]